MALHSCTNNVGTIMNTCVDFTAIVTHDNICPLIHKPINNIWQHAHCTPNVLGLKILDCIDKLGFSLTFLQENDKCTNNTNNLVHSFSVNRDLTYRVYYCFTYFSYSNLFSSGSLLFHRNFHPFLIWFQYINSFYILKRCSLVWLFYDT